MKSLNSPRVTGLSSTSGPLAGGGSLTITGSGFSGAEKVRVGKTDLPGGSWHVNSDTSITIDSMPAATQTGATEILVFNYWNVNPSSPSDAYFYTSDSGPDLAAMQVVRGSGQVPGRALRLGRGRARAVSTAPASPRTCTTSSLP